MIHKLIHLFNSLGKLGASNEEQFKKLSIVSTNITALIAAIITASYCLMYLVVDLELFLPIIIANAIIAPFYFITLLANWSGFHFLAKLSFFIVAFVHLGTDVWILGRDAGTHLFFIVLPALSLLIFDEKELKSKIVVLIGSIIMFIWCHYIFVVPNVGKLNQIIELVIFSFSVISTLGLLFFVLQVFALKLKKSNDYLLCSISDKEKAIDLLSISELELHKSNLAKDKLFSIIAHELRGPLGNFSMILNEYKFSEIPTELHYHMKISAQQTYDLLLDLLEWARCQTNNIEMTPVNFSLCNIIRKLDFFNLKLADKGIELKVNDETQNSYVYADLPSTQSVIRNLVSNALKFTRRNGTIEVKAEDMGDMIKISVIDSGVGISEDRLKSLFNNEGLNTSTVGTDSEQGTGLGLNLCKSFVDLNNGEINVESQIRKGSTFWFTLPKGSKPKVSASQQENQFKDLQILVIEDNFLNL